MSEQYSPTEPEPEWGSEASIPWTANTPMEQLPPAKKMMERPHPMTPFVQGWIAVVGFAIFFGRDAFEGLFNPSARDDAGPWWITLSFLGLMVAGTAVMGYFSWRFTRFVIDDDEVRIERRFISHTSDKIAFSRIQSVDIVQPLVARLFGLAALRIDVGSRGGKKIEYLTRSRAYHLRDYLVTRAHGERTSLDDSMNRAQADVLHDLSSEDEVIVRAKPLNLVLGGLLSFEFLINAGALLGILVAIALTDVPSWGLAAVLPFAFGLFSVVSGRVIGQWNYTLARTRKGMRVSRGMTSLVSQSLPVDRVQGAVISQSIGWKLLGLHRVEIDVLGYGVTVGDNDEAASNILLPIGSWDDVLAAISALWPGFDLSTVPRHPIPKRARRIRWFDAHTYFWGTTDEMIVSFGGLLIHRIAIVPHARVQSVQLDQGPLQRRLRLANMIADTTPGPVSLACAHLDETVARELAFSELDRMRRARELHQQQKILDSFPPPSELEANASNGTTSDSQNDYRPDDSPNDTSDWDDGGFAGESFNR